jgi:hypothetical protein
MKTTRVIKEKGARPGTLGMDIFSKDELRILVEAQATGCTSLSIYMPAYRAGRADVQQNPIRLKNHLREAGERLIETGLPRTEVDAFLQPAVRLLDDGSFWTNMSDGLAVFLSRDFFRYYRLPTPFPELVVVANRFHVKPLLPLLATDGRFYIMAISQNAVRLLDCTRFGFNEMDIAEKIPRNLGEALKYDDTDREAQYHSHLVAPGAGAGIISGHHGPEVEDTKENLLRFFSLIDRGLHRDFLHDETAPLVLFCVDYLFPIYQKANTYKYLIDKAVEGNPDRTSPLELHRQGVDAVINYFMKRQEEAVRLYQGTSGHERSARDFEVIVPAAYQGRIYILFIDVNQHKWGTYAPSTDKLEIHNREEPGDVDLVDFAAAHTLTHGGEVFTVEAGKVPDGASIAAVLRY